MCVIPFLSIDPPHLSNVGRQSAVGLGIVNCSCRLAKGLAIIGAEPEVFSHIFLVASECDTYQWPGVRGRQDLFITGEKFVIKNYLKDICIIVGYAFLLFFRLKSSC